MQEEFIPQIQEITEGNLTNPHNPSFNHTNEIIIHAKSGFCILFLNFFLMLLGIFSIVLGTSVAWFLIPIGVILFISIFFMFKGFFSNQPNEAAVFTFFGKYIETVNKSGFFWVNPFASIQKISLRANNLNGEVIKVNDKVGNPIMVVNILMKK